MLEAENGGIFRIRRYKYSNHLEVRFKAVSKFPDYRQPGFPGRPFQRNQVEVLNHANQVFGRQTWRYVPLLFERQRRDELFPGLIKGRLDLPISQLWIETNGLVLVSSQLQRVRLLQCR